MFFFKKIFLKNGFFNLLIATGQQQGYLPTCSPGNSMYLGFVSILFWLELGVIVIMIKITITGF